MKYVGQCFCGAAEIKERHAGRNELLPLQFLQALVGCTSERVYALEPENAKV